MATWQQVRDYLKSNYKIGPDQGERLRIEFEVRPGRTQLVFLTHQTLMDGAEEWVLIESPFAQLGEVDLQRLLIALENKVCGGLGTADGKFLVLRHAVPLANLDINELERPMQLLINTADAFEFDISGQDRF